MERGGPAPPLLFFREGMSDDALFCWDCATVAAQEAAPSAVHPQSRMDWKGIAADRTNQGRGHRVMIVCMHRPESAETFRIDGDSVTGPHYWLSFEGHDGRESSRICFGEDIRGLCAMLESALRQAELLAAEAEIAAE